MGILEHQWRRDYFQETRLWPTSGIPTIPESFRVGAFSVTNPNKQPQRVQLNDYAAVKDTVIRSQKRVRSGGILWWIFTSP